MNERWRERLNGFKQFVPEPLQMEWRQHVTPQWKKHIEQPIKNKLDQRNLASYEYNFDGSDEPTVVLENTRKEMLNHLAEVMKGRGGESQEQADEITSAHVDIVAKALELVGADIATNRKHRFDSRDPQALLGILIADDTSRREELSALMPKGMQLFPIKEDMFRCISYSLVDPGKDSVVDPKLEQSIQIVDTDKALDLYKDIMRWQIENAIRTRTPNIAEFGDPNANVKRAVLGVGTAAIIALIFGQKKA